MLYLQKYDDDTWPESEFVENEVVLPSGEVVKMNLAERGVYYKNQKLWVREVRKLNESSIKRRYRELESTIRSKTTLLSRQQAKYGTLILETTDGKEKEIQKYVQDKAILRETIETLEKEIEQLKATKKTRTNISSFPGFRKKIHFRI